MQLFRPLAHGARKFSRQRQQFELQAIKRRLCLDANCRHFLLQEIALMIHSGLFAIIGPKQHDYI
jgi:hypothetical protein